MYLLFKKKILRKKAFRPLTKEELNKRPTNSNKITINAKFTKEKSGLIEPTNLWERAYNKTRHKYVTIKDYKKPYYCVYNIYFSQKNPKYFKVHFVNKLPI